MKNNAFKYSGFLAVFTFILLASCNKFDEGGNVSDAETNLVKTWILETYLRNGVDETSSLLISGYTETYTQAGSYTRTYRDDENESETQTGQWAFQEDYKQLHLSGVGSIRFTQASGTLSSSYYSILRLEENVFWYSFENGGDRHEFRLISE